MVEVDGVRRNAYSTSISFSMTLEDLMHAIAVAATRDLPPGERFEGSLSHNRIARESFWSEQDTERARRVARALGPGRIYATARAEFRANGESWRDDAWDGLFPPEVARQRANELFPMLRTEGNPFAAAPNLTDR